VEFSEVREYVPGDDVRIIDWNVTARMNEPYVKEFIEERDLTVYILFDASGSSDFGTNVSKKDIQMEISASFMFAAMKNNDNIGLFIFTEGVEKFVPARKGRKHCLRLIRELVAFSPKNKKTNISKTLDYVSSIVRKKSIFFVISDFLFSDKSDEEAFEKKLKLLKIRHDVICLNINDICEQNIPDVGFIRLEDEETGEQVLVNTSDENFRKSYIAYASRKNEQLKKDLLKSNIDMININSEENFVLPVQRFFRLREKRNAR
jgi:uncharacterized protein (DUF58 family)